MRGEAGIGKTTLLETLAVRSGDAVTVIRTCGAETEAELTFSRWPICWIRCWAS